MKILYSSVSNRKVINYVYIWENFYQVEVPLDESGKRCVIHHIDFDHTNNNIQNLVCITRKEQKRLSVKHSDKYSKVEKEVIEVNENDVTCPYCNKTGDIYYMKRFHFDNCDLKGDEMTTFKNDIEYQVFFGDNIYIDLINFYRKKINLEVKPYIFFHTDEEVQNYLIKHNSLISPELKKIKCKSDIDKMLEEVRVFRLIEKKKICKTCGKEFTTYYSQTQFCSDKCKSRHKKQIEKINI